MTPDFEYEDKKGLKIKIKMSDDFYVIAVLLKELLVELRRER